MSRRTLMLVVLGLMAVGLPWILAPLLRYQWLGLRRGEQFYAGRPTCYWRERILAWEQGKGRIKTSSEDVDRFLALHNLNGAPAVLTGKPGAVPVLIELLADDDWVVRMTAVSALRGTSPVDSRAVNGLADCALKDADRDVRWEALSGLGDLVRRESDPVDQRMEIGALVQVLKSEDSDMRLDVISVLTSLGPNAKSAVPAIIRAMKEEKDGDVLESMKWALKEIDPASAASSEP